MKQAKKIAVFTGNRAEFGLLLPIITAIELHENLTLQLYVSGAHLNDEFGTTVSQIEAAGIPITDKIVIDSVADDLLSSTIAISQGIEGLAVSLQRHKPDLMLIYGDRFEAFAAAIAASQMGIPVGHVEGGDITEGGALDDSVRHAITKLAHVHFTTNQMAYDNVLRLGEEHWRVHEVGLPSIDSIVTGNFATPDEIEKRWGISNKTPVVLFTQHSVASEYDQAGTQISTAINAMSQLLQDNAAFRIVATYPNNDAGGHRIIEQLKKFASLYSEQVTLTPSLGGYYYHGILSLSKCSGYRLVCVGNSSSGIKETPIFGCPTVNIGSRQNGRVRGENVLDVDYCSEAIYDAIHICLYNDDFREKCQYSKNPYGDGTAATRVVDVISSLDIDKKLLQKKTRWN